MPPLLPLHFTLLITFIDDYAIAIDYFHFDIIDYAII
jgi:hypothetical protein